MPYHFCSYSKRGRTQNNILPLFLFTIMPNPRRGVCFKEVPKQKRSGRQAPPRFVQKSSADDREAYIGTLREETAIVNKKLNKKEGKRSFPTLVPYLFCTCSKRGRTQNHILPLFYLRLCQILRWACSKEVPKQRRSGRQAPPRFVENFSFFGARAVHRYSEPRKRKKANKN